MLNRADFTTFLTKDDVNSVSRALKRGRFFADCPEIHEFEIKVKHFTQKEQVIVAATKVSTLDYFRFCPIHLCGTGHNSYKFL